MSSEENKTLVSGLVEAVRKKNKVTSEVVEKLGKTLQSKTEIESLASHISLFEPRTLQNTQCIDSRLGKAVLDILMDPGCLESAKDTATAGALIETYKMLVSLSPQFLPPTLDIVFALLRRNETAALADRLLASLLATFPECPALQIQAALERKTPHTLSETLPPFLANTLALAEKNEKYFALVFSYTLGILQQLEAHYEEKSDEIDKKIDSALHATLLFAQRFLSQTGEAGGGTLVYKGIAALFGGVVRRKSTVAVFFYFFFSALQERAFDVLLGALFEELLRTELGEDFLLVCVYIASFVARTKNVPEDLVSAVHRALLYAARTHAPGRERTSAVIHATMYISCFHKNTPKESLGFILEHCEDMLYNKAVWNMFKKKTSFKKHLQTQHKLKHHPLLELFPLDPIERLPASWSLIEAKYNKFVA
ncbi:MAG: uncharacterized protein A8A55_0655 [Amphiamblys sp. WSBS2006]|nr:MAG: uncharacterized protein A8A55_0655 [Amphiamblys sp. WSBS2006]